MDHSPMARLPAELRNLIYEHVLHENEAQIFTEPGLLRTCRAIRNEAELMFYSLNSFAVSVHEEAINHSLCRWLKVKAGPRIRMVRSLRIRCEMPSVGLNAATSGARPDSEDTENDSHLLGFLHLMHLMSSIRQTAFAENLESVVCFTLNGAKDDESLDKIDDMALEDQDRYRGAKFLILSLIHGERAVLDAIDASGTRELLDKLDTVVQEGRGRMSAFGVSNPSDG